MARRSPGNPREDLVLASLRALLGSPDGRRVLTYLVEDLLRIRGSSFVGNALESAHREGYRSAARQIEIICKRAFPEAYTAALIERLNEVEALDRPTDKEAQDE